MILQHFKRSKRRQLFQLQRDRAKLEGICGSVGLRDLKLPNQSAVTGNLSIELFSHQTRKRPEYSGRFNDLYERDLLL